MSEEYVDNDSSDVAYILPQQYRTVQCPNCKKKAHCLAGVKKGDEEEKVVMVKDRCNNAECNCKCRTHFVGKDGKLHKYGQPDNTSALFDMSEDKRLPIDDLIDQANKEYNENRNDKRVIKKDD